MREIRAKMREPHAAARRRRADARARFQRQPVVGRAGQRVAAHEQEIGGIDARGHGGDRELGRRLRRQILERVHGELDAPLDERLLDLAHEHALRADRAERAVVFWSPDVLMIVSSTAKPKRSSAAAIVPDCVRASSEPRVPSRNVASRAHASPLRARAAPRPATLARCGAARRAVQRRAQLVGELGLEPAQEGLERAVGPVVQQAAQPQARDVREAAREHLGPGLDRGSLRLAQAPSGPS